MARPVLEKSLVRGSELSPASSLRLPVNRIQRFCLQDGPGIRTTVFTQGCSLRCWWCHNPEMIPIQSPRATPYAIDDLFSACVHDARYWSTSGGGVTVSGGECLLHADAVAEFLKILGEAGHHRAIDTSGAVSLPAVQCVSDHTDLWLWDLKALSPEVYRNNTGGSVEQTLTNLIWVLQETTARVILRIPLINHVQTAEGELDSMVLWIKNLPRPVDVEILPGHNIGSESSIGQTPAVTGKQLNQAQSIFAKHGLEVAIRW